MSPRSGGHVVGRLEQGEERREGCARIGRLLHPLLADVRADGVEHVGARLHQGPDGLPVGLFGGHDERVDHGDAGHLGVVLGQPAGQGAPHGQPATTTFWHRSARDAVGGVGRR